MPFGRFRIGKTDGGGGGEGESVGGSVSCDEIKSIKTGASDGGGEREDAVKSIVGITEDLEGGEGNFFCGREKPLRCRAEGGRLEKVRRCLGDFTLVSEGGERSRGGMLTSKFVSGNK